MDFGACAKNEIWGCVPLKETRMVRRSGEITKVEKSGTGASENASVRKARWRIIYMPYISLRGIYIPYICAGWPFKGLITHVHKLGYIPVCVYPPP